MFGRGFDSRQLHNFTRGEEMLRGYFVALLCVMTLVTQAQLRELSLEELYGDKAKFSPAGVSYPYALRDGKHYTTLDPKQGILISSFATGKTVGTALNFKDLPDSIGQVESYSYSADERYLLLETKSESIYRRSAVAEFWIYDLKEARAQRLSQGGKQRLATFSPDGKNVAFVRDNNIYVVDVLSGSEVQITQDGLRNEIINGAADWVYEEEFALSRALWWSPNSERLAFLRFDESKVPEYSMMYYDSLLYPNVYSYKYPKAGEANSVVTLHVYNIKDGQRLQVDVGKETDQYIPRVVWSPSGALCYLRENRLQNQIEILEADLQTGASRLVFAESDACYIEEPTDWYLTFLDSGKQFIIPSERSGYRQLYLCSWDGATPPKALTKGENEIIEVYGYSPKNKRVYYRAYDNSPLQTALYSIKTDGSDLRKMSEGEGSVSVWFNNSMTYYIQTFSNAQQVPQITLHTQDGKRVRILEDNKALQQKLSNYHLPERRFFTFKTPDGVTLNGYMVLPVAFDSTMVYPVMMYQYSGPNSQSVLNKWKFGWDEFLASRGCLVICVDGRGTGGRGVAFRKCTYGQLGNLETQDQLYAAEYVASLPFTDAKRIGIWGWSYGGYMSLLCKLKGEDLFRMCIAVAPVTNWRFYDSIYTERFMGLPSTNAKGYDENAPLHFADRLKGSLLLMHGTYDDNVHIQHSMRIVERFVQAQKQFEMQFYPDRNHNIYGNGATLHLYTRMWDYIGRQLM